MSSSSFMVSITTRTPSWRAVIRRVASMPSSRGIAMSITTTSGEVSATTWRASTPSAAVPTTSIPSSAPSRATSPSRTIWWSSTTMTRMLTRPAPSPTSPHGGAGGGRGRGCRPRGAGDLAVPSELLRALAQRQQADPHLPVGVDASSVVRDLDLEGSVHEHQPDPAAVGSGVTRGVAQRLGGDPVGRHLDRGGQRGEALRLDGGPERLVLGQLGQGAHEPAVVQGGGTQVVDEPAHVGDHLLHLRTRLPQLGLGRVGFPVDEEPGGLEPEHHAGQSRPQAVVEVPADAPAFLLAGQHHPLPTLLELVGHPAGARRRGRLPDQVAEQLLVAAGETAAQAPRRQHQAPDGGPPVGDRQGPGPVRTIAVGRHQLLAARAVDLDADEADAERRRDRPGDRRELGGRVVGRLQGRGQPGDGTVGVRTTTEHDAGAPAAGAAGAADRRAARSAPARPGRPGAGPASCRAPW